MEVMCIRNKKIPSYNLLIIPIALVLGLAFLFSSCKDENLMEPSPSDTPLGNGLVKMDLPGVMTMKISSTGKLTTRDGESGNSNSSHSFNDGMPAEYDLAPGSDHHFAIIYEKNNDSKTPLAILPLSFDEENVSEDSQHDNITLTAKSVVCSEDMKLTVGDMASFKNVILKGNEAYILLNFDCSKIYKPATTASIAAGRSNAENLFSITRAQFLSLPLSDYKITAKKSNVDTDFFTMSNSVYLDASSENVIVDYTINHENVFREEESAQAVENPAIEAHVERLAVKYTLEFKQGTFTTSDNQTEDEGENRGTFKNDGYYELDAGTGLPKYSITINKYTGYTNTINGYSVNSEPAIATVSVLGYYVNNTEKQSYALKHLKVKNYFTPDPTVSAHRSWTDCANWRSYWSEDPNYTLEKKLISDDTYRTKGYPHQFRQALETDSVLQLHGVNKDGRSGYKYEDGEPYRRVTRKNLKLDANGVPERDDNGNLVYEEKEVDYYEYLGSIDNASLNDECVLKYWSFEEMQSQYTKFKDIENRPFYSLENTYYDSGMTTGERVKGDWVWPWNKAAYSAATNLTILAQLMPDEGADNQIKTLYRGQNNIFYYDLHGDQGLLKSKLDIFNEVILNQGNGGINVIHAFFASHGFLSTGDDTFHSTNLEKVRWSPGSVLWIAKVKDDGSEIEYWEATESDLTLIPAEISGGDGQCLIAPNVMGASYKFFLAPVQMDGNGNPVKQDKPREGHSEPEFARNRSESEEISFNHLVALIHKSIGPIDVFTDGKMYYSIPVPHRINALKMTGTDASWKTLANIGAVRNNWYNITVSNISNVGTPVHDVTQPIVPVMEVVRNYINAKVEVYGWHTITQSGIPMQ